MNTLLKHLLLSSGLLINSQTMATSVQVFKVTPMVSSITMAPNASTTLNFTVTNNTAVALKITNLQSFGDLTNVQSSVTTDTCTGNTIASGSDCSATITITSPNTRDTLTGYINMKACIDEGGYCSASRNNTPLTITPPCSGPNGECLVLVSESVMKGDMKVLNSTRSASCNTSESDGLSRANCICRYEGASLGLKGNWHAWLSTTSKDAKDNINYTESAIYIRASDHQLLASPGNLLSGVLVNSILPSTGYRYQVWTQTSSIGTLYTGYDNCSDWSDATNSIAGINGVVTSVDSRWTAMFSSSCDEALKLYCFQG